jgi:hypothetical protein
MLEVALSTRIVPWEAYKDGMAVLFPNNGIDHILREAVSQMESSALIS